MKKAAIVMGSDSDLKVVDKCIDELKKYDVETDIHVFSAHRTPDEAVEFAKHAEENNFGVIISAAGKAAHLGGILAANTVLPIIGIPIKSSALEGVDALLSTVQMPPGIPVACVAIDGAKNAAVLAVQILALSDSKLNKKLKEERKRMHDSVIEKDRKVNEMYK